MQLLILAMSAAIYTLLAKDWPIGWFIVGCTALLGGLLVIDRKVVRRPLRE